MLQDLAARTPADISSDSVRMRAILKDHCKGKHSKPWELQDNGDLKLILFKFLRAKGPHSVRFNKVKGHATDEDVRDGSVTQIDKTGNDNADAAAKAGLHLVGPCAVNITDWAAVRHERYIAFMNKIHHIILHMYFNDQDHQPTLTMTLHPHPPHPKRLTYPPGLITATPPTVAPLPLNPYPMTTAGSLHTQHNFTPSEILWGTSSGA